MSKHRYKRAKMLIYLLALTMLASPLTSCSQSNMPPEESVEQSDSYEAESQIKSLQEINAKFSKTTWHGKEYLAIEEDSLLQIIELAMEDAKNFYIKHKAPGLTIEKDGTTTRNPDKFYIDWMNKYHFLARAKRESGSNYMVNFIGEPVNEAGYRAMGIMAIVPEWASATLDEYCPNHLNVETNFFNLQLVPSKSDVQNYKVSKEAYDNIKQCVYNSVYTSICYDIYNAKSFGPNHEDYYEKYGGYDEEMRHKLIISLYFYRRSDILDDLKSGKIKNTFFKKQYVKDILSFQEEFENQAEKQRD